MTRVETKLNNILRTRNRRALFNLGGKVIKEIFGNMDDEDKKRITRKFKRMEKELDFQQNTMKEVTSLMTKTTQEFGKALKNCFMNDSILMSFENNFNRISRIENRVEQQISHNRLLSDVILWFKFLADVQSESLSELKNALDNLESGIFNNEILSFETIQKDVNEVKSESLWTRSPFEEHHTEMEIKKLIRFGGFRIDNDVILMITVPLIALEKNKIFQFQAIPNINDDVATTLKTHNQLLVVSRNLDKYFFVDKKELESKTKKINDEYFWSETIKWNAEKCCEMAIVMQDEKIKNETCEVLTFRIADTLIMSTDETNEFIVIPKDQVTAKFIGDEAQSFVIKKPSKITINTKGVLKVNKWEIQFPERQHKIVEKQIHLRTLNIDMKCLNETVSPEHRYLIPHINNSAVSYNELEKSSASFKLLTKRIERHEKSKQESHMKRMSTIIGSVTALMLIIIAISIAIYILHRKKNCQKEENKIELVMTTIKHQEIKAEEAFVCGEVKQEDHK
jgi:hypothetical protein